MNEVLETILMIVGALLGSIALSIVIVFVSSADCLGLWRNSKWIDEEKKKLRKMNEEKNLEKLLKEMEEKGEVDEKE